MNTTYKILILVGLLCIIPSCKTYKNRVNEKVNNLPNTFYQRWVLDYGEINGEKIIGLPNSPENDYEFKENRTYILYSSIGENMIGTWEFNETESCVYTKRDNGEINGKFIDIKPNSIILIPAEKTIFEYIKFYYIPATK